MSLCAPKLPGAADSVSLLRLAKDARMQGKQMTSGALKHENSKINPGTFEPPKLLWSEQKDKYSDCIRYKELIPAERKKNGFLSSDFPRRDEFSNTIRTEQLREILKVGYALSPTPILSPVLKCTHVGIGRFPLRVLGHFP